MRSTYLAAALLFAAVSAATAQQPAKAPAKAAPSIGVSRAFAHEQQVWDADRAGDVAKFNQLVAGPFTYIDDTGIMAWDFKTTERIKDCTMTSFESSDVHTQQPAAGIVILSYKATHDQTCKGVKSPSPIYALSVWQRKGNSWKLIAHSETPARP